MGVDPVIMDLYVGIQEWKVLLAMNYRVSSPVAPAQYSLDEAIAWTRGWQDAAAEGEESLWHISPYDVDEESTLYEAWQAGFDSRT